MRSPQRTNLPSIPLIAFFVLALSVSAADLPSARAQELNLHSISGTVFLLDEPVPGATVTLMAVDGDVKQEAETDPDGAYEFTGLPAGEYELTASHDCCESGAARTELGGTTLSETVDLFLIGPDAPHGDDVATITGRVYDRATDAPIGGVNIGVSNQYQGDANTQYQYFNIVSGRDGTYTVSVNVGVVEIWVDAQGYDYTSGRFNIEDDRTLDIPMQASKENTVRLFGVLRSSSGEPLADASISVSRDWQACENGGCPEPLTVEDRAMPVPAPGPEGEGWTYNPRDHGYAWTQTARDGSWSVTTTPGAIRLSAWAQDHLQVERRMTVSSGDDREVNLVLEQIPPDSVRITGRITDAADGRPIPFANVNVENQRWGHWNWTQTDADGRFETWTKPGYTILTASAYREYYRPCESVGVTAEPSSEGSADLAIRAPYPECEQGKRDHDYFQRVATFTSAANAERSLDLALKRAPPPDAVFEGWAVNASSDRGVPNAIVSFFNEATREWGQAEVDDDGSFRIDVRGGYFTIRTYAEGYYDTVMNVEIASGETQRLVIEMTPGKRAHGGCCIAYAESAAVDMDRAVASDDSVATGAPPPSAPQAAGDGDLATAQGAESGDPVFLGGAGNLGPYDPSASGNDPDDADVGNDAPWPAVTLLVLAAMAAALVRRPRR